MIASQDRSGYIGASDVQYVIGNWKTKTWEKWWMQKLGINRDHFDNEFTKAGTNWEHRILDSLNLPNLEKDKQIIIGRLRVNLDGNTPWKIYECKTHHVDKEFKVSADYRRQVNVQMFASGIYEACIVAYGLEDEDYSNYYRDIDLARLTEHPIEYDDKFIGEYQKRLDYLSYCSDNGLFPQEGAV